jgi:Family of unknown function (DUF6361)
MLQIGWIDFSNEHRDKVMSVLDALKEKGAVDELGIGIIRDRLADLLFPGISTIQTRAKYFLLIPWIIQHLETRKVRSKDFVQELHKLEYKFIDILAEGNDEIGVFGRDSRGDLKRKPSSVYWNALRTYKICKLNLSLHQYVGLIDDVIRNNEHNESELKEADKEQGGDDLDALATITNGSFWNVCSPLDNWLDDLSIQLTKKEAEFLREAIRFAVPDSLLAYLLSREHLHKIDDMKNIETVTSILPDLPEKLQQNVLLALDFANLIYGANIRYNIIFNHINRRENETVNERWVEWCAHMKNEFPFDRWDTSLLFYKTDPDKPTRYFIEKWVEFVFSKQYDQTSEIDELIRKRELFKKDTRSKLRVNHQSVESWIGLGKLTYRWKNVRDILHDIQQGISSDV